MGMHIGIVAARVTVQELVKVFSRTWPQYEQVASCTSFDDVDALWSWKDANEKFVSAADWKIDNPGKEVFFFWQDGAWAWLLDASYTLASDAEKLAALSADVGTVLSFIVESSGGCAFFWCFENGILRRKIINSGGEIELEGEPLPEEQGINPNEYYMDETESLWRAFGISPSERLSSPAGCHAISVINRTDYSAQ